MELIVGIFATYRLSQLVAQDAISEPLRAWLSKRGAAPESLGLTRRWLSYGLHCVICVSIWAGALIALALVGVSIRALVYGLAYSGGAVALGSWLARNNNSKGG